MEHKHLISGDADVTKVTIGKNTQGFIENYYAVLRLRIPEMTPIGVSQKYKEVETRIRIYEEEYLELRKQLKESNELFPVIKVEGRLELKVKSN